MEGLIRPTVSYHARRRFKERIGLPIRAAKRAAFEALHHGKKLEDLHFAHRDRLVRMAAQQVRNGDVVFFRVHMTHAFVFAVKPDGTIHLVTVLPYYETEDDATDGLRRAGGAVARRKGFQ